MTRSGVAAIVLAAGLGKRMRSQRPKVLHELGGEPLLTFPLRLLRAVEVDPIVVVVGPQAGEVRKVAEPFGVRFAVQQSPRGTGDAVAAGLAALPQFPRYVLILPSDLPLIEEETLRRLLQAHLNHDATLTLLVQEASDPTGFGRVIRDVQGNVLTIREHADCTPEERQIREVNVGVYCADREFLVHVLPRLRSDNAQQELYFTDAIAHARAGGRKVVTAWASPGETVQVSDQADLARCEKLLRRRLAERWMIRGVTIVDPDSTYLGPNVDIGLDVVLGPNVILQGRTTVGNGTRIDGSAQVVNCRIGERCHLKFGVVLQDAELADEVIVGPFAHLRPGTQLGQGVHIGNFVETKNARLGRGVKANHLTYLGDAEVGEETNIGAGTITCNYDGFAKHQTVIGARVQVGSDSQFVAPVTVGDDAYIATATTVRRDVSPGALVYNPRQQKERLGWVAQRRARHERGGKGEMEE